MKRKRRISSLSIVVILIAIAAAIYFGGGYGSRRKTMVKRTRIMFDTVVSISLTAPGSFDLSPVFREVWGELDAWENAVDAYDSNSALFSLNRSVGETVVPSRLSTAIRVGLDAIEATGGAFDIRIGGLTAIWDFDGEGRIPRQEEIDSALASFESPISLSGDTVFKSTFEPNIDLGGIAKGLAADAVCGILDTIPAISRYLVDLGGNIRAVDTDGKAFNIGIRHPRDPDALAGKFTLESGMSCATAGDYQRFFEVEGRRYHHILDPSTGRPARRCAAVTVVARDAATADILSTALFVMGPKKELGFLQTHPGISAVLYDTSGHRIGGDLEVE